MNAAPIPKDTQDFQFKHACTQQVCDNLNNIPIACSLIVSDGKRGLLYIGYKNKLTVLKYNGDSDSRCVIDYDLPQTISKLSISCDYSFLGITFNKSTAYIYNANLLSKNTLEVLHEVQLSSSTPNVFGYDLRWNPAVPGMFCTVASDYTIGCFQINVEQKTTMRLVALERIAGLEAMCVAWSPKGKQLVIGCKNGNIVQLKPELKVARTIPGPSPAIGEVIGILWLSNYQFCAAYSNINERRINVLIVNAPKGETVASFVCYEDITYGMPDMEGEYSPRYYFDHIPEWNLIIAASSSSSEVAVLGSLDNGANWEQWQLIDSARAQLPLIRTTETYPVGMTIDKSSTIKLPWGPENTLPDPVPMLHIFGTSGQIISIHMVNLQPNCPAICSPPSEPATIMPSQSRMSILPSEISFNNHSGMTSTPRPKPVESIIEKPKPLSNVNIFNNPLATSSLTSAELIVPPTPSTTQTIASAPAPVAHVDLKIPKPRSEIFEAPQIQRTEQARLSPVKEVSVITPTSENPDFDDSICWRAYQEELTHFEKELRVKLEPQVWQVGTEDERQRLIAQYAEIDEFWRELRETTNSLSNEIGYLKALLLQSFAWVEETKSRNSANGSDAPRDRHDRSKIQELQRLATHTQTQLIQALKAIDMQWSEYQSQERSKMKIPNLEYIYQALKKQSEIVARQKKIINKQITKIRALNKGNKMSNLNRSIVNLSLNSSTLGGSFGLNVNGGIIETRCRTIANNTKKFTTGKQSKLRGILLHNAPSVIKPIVPTPVQDRLEATLSSLATLSPVTASSKQKIGKLIPDRPAVTKVSQIITTTTTTVTPIQKTTATSHNPLASLTNIVANIGSSGSEIVTPSLAPSQSQPQSKSQPAPFSMGTLSSIFANNTSSAEKINTSGNMQFNLKTNVSNQSPIVPAPSTTQSSIITTAFPKVMSISFGTPEQKTTESATTVNTTTKETSQKNIPSLKPVDLSNTVQSTQPLFDTNLFASSMSITPSSTVKNDMFSASSQAQTSTGLGSGLALSFKDSLPQVTSSQQTVFSFASPSSTTAVLKTTANTTNNAPAESIQTFSFASKPFNTSAVVSPTKTEPTAPVKSAIRANLELSKMTTALPSFNLAEKPSSTVAGTTSFATSFGNLSTPISSTINFGKALSVTPNITQPQQENKTSITLPAGTSIEKVGGTTGTPTSTTSGSSIFGSNIISPTNTFGTSIFGGASMSSALTPPAAASSPTVDKTPVTSSTTSIFSSPSNSIFSKNSTTSWETGTLPSAAPPAYDNSQFRNILGDLNVKFGQPSQPAEASSIFDKTPTTPPVSASVIAPSSPFAQSPSSPLNATNLVKSPSTTTASTGFFANNANTSTNSIFGGMANATATPSKLFGGNATSPTATTSIFGGGAATPAAASSPGAQSSIFGGSIFGGSSTFGAQSSMPAAAPASVFGASPAFAAKPTFGGQPPIFGAAKPEFNSPFGSSGFGSPAGFGAAPSLAGSPPAFGNTQMGKVFGSPTGNSTFESLAGQSNQLGFDSLAQKSPSPEKPQTFSGGSSFSSWR
ncbi:hypothetical protein PV327_005515 [Microctonus hyperodae]|uniref:Nucleoporin Nup159/Nup146 N-terminal domain-containing protein n=1 Tax=Microctonus hyperodae TaxID=165561 RepID=A0AA39G1I1_MICHY|nr:hypothetical protein PV327_005515 [Microctonus hyperodae]